MLDGPHEPLRVGVVGTGFSAARHIDALRRTLGVEIVALVGADPARTRELAAHFGIARAYDDPERMLAESGVDAVHNCTVNSRHAPVSLAALEAGVHVLSEKPLAVDAIESARLVAAAERAERDGVVAGVCFNYRHYPLVAELRGLIATGDYGTPHFVRGSYLQDWLLFESDWNWRLEADEGGASRAIADIGTHWADLVQHVVRDPIVEVFADLGTLHATRQRPRRATSTFASDSQLEREPVEIKTEDYGSVLVRLASGARGAFTVSQTSAGRKNGLSLHVDAPTASFGWDQERPDVAWIGRRSAPNLELVRDPAQLHGAAAALSRLPAGHPEGWSDALANAVADFYASVRAARSGADHDRILATFRDGHERVALVDAVLASHREQRWTPVAVTQELAA